MLSRIFGLSNTPHPISKPGNNNSITPLGTRANAHPNNSSNFSGKTIILDAEYRFENQTIEKKIKILAQEFLASCGSPLENFTTKLDEDQLSLFFTAIKELPLPTFHKEYITFKYQISNAICPADVCYAKMIKSYLSSDLAAFHKNNVTDENNDISRKSIFYTCVSKAYAHTQSAQINLISSSIDFYHELYQHKEKADLASTDQLDLSIRHQSNDSENHTCTPDVPNSTKENFHISTEKYKNEIDQAIKSLQTEITMNGRKSIDKAGCNIALMYLLGSFELFVNHLSTRMSYAKRLEFIEKIQGLMQAAAA
ncbi:hypothetical protein QS306_03810 [Paraburkholderia bonniea]|uniref:hypothetical protein n=1 Tax=Paraburkholderia bonniea TaxID=2152891 RepID=UPI0025745293|nr:hypothetical protein [Paraburkholderia bonniea]WJF90801.1 hypothetical protein QS306_03810 [Paraburkholderia bonniea]WJF94115.1 hypothetical protein QS308_03810 [Paraburkholderia bonniea]